MWARTTRSTRPTTALKTWIQGQGRTPSAIMWERYLSDPDAEPDPSKWLTEVVWPVE